MNIIKKLFKNIRDRKKYDKLFYPYKEEQFLLGMKDLINDYYNNNILFYIIKIDFEPNKTYNIDDINIESYLMGIDLLEFCYASKKKDKVFLLVGRKSILGYDSSFISNYNSHSQGENNSYYYLDESRISFRIKYLRKKSDIKSCFKYLVRGYNFESHYVFMNNYLNKKTGSLFYYFLCYCSNIADRTRDKYFETLPKLRYTLGRRWLEEGIFYYNNINIYSVRKKSRLSILNMWNTYMLYNKIYYNKEDKKLYKKLENGEYEYFSELSYLIDNVWLIFHFLELRYSDELSGYPIENLLSKYLLSAYNLLLIGVDGFIPVLGNEEKMTEEEEREIRYFNNERPKKIKEFRESVE